MKHLLKEYYVNIYPKDSGIPLVVWIDNNQAYKKGGHSYRLKFKYKNEWIPLMLPSMEVPEVILSNISINTKTLDNVRRFAETNLDLLMAAKDGIDTETLKNNIKSIDDSEINIIDFNEQNYTIKTAEIHGFRLVQNNDTKKYNFIDSQNNLLSQVWFDKPSGNFTEMGDEIFVFIMIDNIWYKLKNNGKIENF